MNNFLVETAMLLAIAFVIGASVGCFLRSLVASFGKKKVPSEAAAAAAVASTAATAVLAEEPASEAEEPGDVICVAHGYRGMARYVDEFPFPVSKYKVQADPFAIPAAVPKAVEEAVSSTAEAASDLTSTVTQTVKSASEAVSSAAAQTAATAAAAAAATAAVAAATPDEPAPTTTAVGLADEKSDRLTLIKAITSEDEQQLNALGIHRYEQIANWTPADVEKIDAALGAPARVAHENWIEQAKILAFGGLTKFARNVGGSGSSSDETGGGTSGSSGPALNGSGTGGTAPTGTSQASPNLSGAAAAAAAIVGAAAAPAQKESKPEGQGTLTASTADDTVDWLPPIGKYTLYTLTQRPGKRRRIFSGNGGGSHLLEDEIDDLFLDEVSRPIRRNKPRRSPHHAPKPDDLKKIKPIGVTLETKLNAIGIRRFEQIANMGPEDFAELSRRLGGAIAVDREQWTKEAQNLLKNGR